MREQDKLKFEELKKLFIGSKWTECGPLGYFQPDSSEKYINLKSLDEALDILVEENS
jgi:hypothetical protein